MQVRPQLIQRWENVPEGATRTVNLSVLQASIGSTDLRRYCLGVVFDIRGDLTAGDADANPVDMWAAAGTVSLSYKGGKLASQLDCRDLVYSMQAEGMAPTFRGLVPWRTNNHDAHDDYHYCGILAFAPAQFGQYARSDRNFDGAMPVSMLGSQSTFRITLGALPGTWAFGEGNATVSVWAVILESREKIVPTHSEIRTMDYTEDPLEISGEFQKLYSLAVRAQDYSTLAALYDDEHAFPVLTVDGINVLEGDLNEHERLWNHICVDTTGEILDPLTPGPAANRSLSPWVLVVLTPFHSDRISEMAAGKKHLLRGMLAPAGEDLAVVYRSIEKLSSSDYNAWLALENIDVASGAEGNLMVGSTPIAKTKLTATEGLGVPLKIGSAKKPGTAR